ncbi:hypothetical protein EMIT051CA3_50333 [Pseudomonas chlororaphis]
MAYRMIGYCCGSRLYFGNLMRWFMLIYHMFMCVIKVSPAGSLVFGAKDRTSGYLYNYWQLYLLLK